MNDDCIINFNAAFPTNFNENFWKHIQGQFQEQFLKLGIWQFYPDYITITKDHMIVTYEQNQVQMQLIDASVFEKRYHEFFAETNVGACI